MVFLLLGLVLAGCVGYWIGSALVHAFYHR